VAPLSGVEVHLEKRDGRTGVLDVSEASAGQSACRRTVRHGRGVARGEGARARAAQNGAWHGTVEGPGLALREAKKPLRDQVRRLGKGEGVEA
jgi:hypothetical protein